MHIPTNSQKCEVRRMMIQTNDGYVRAKSAPESPSSFI